MDTIDNKKCAIASSFLIPIVWFGGYVMTTHEHLILNSLILILIGCCNKNQGILVAIGLLVGIFSDLGLNGISYLYRNTTTRSTALQKYFTKIGTIPAALYGGTLAALMIFNTYAILEIMGYTQESKNENVEKVFVGLFLAFVVGAIWGILGEPSKAFKPLLPFYKSTLGLLENRFWDGIAIVLAMAVVYLLKIEFDEIPV